MTSRIFLRLEHMIADNAITSELGGFHARFPITFYMLPGSDRFHMFMRCTGVHRVNRESPPFRGFSEEEDVQLCQARGSAIPELSSRFKRQNVRLDPSYTLNARSPGSNHNWLSFPKASRIPHTSEFNICEIFVSSKARNCT